MEKIEFRIERLILKVGNVLSNARMKDLSDNNLSSAQSEAILFYAENEGKNIKDLSDYLNISHQAAQKLVKKLQDKGIADVYVSSEDKRYVNVHLTDEGLGMCSKLKENGASIGGLLLKNFSDDEKKMLFDYFKRIEKNIT